VEKVLRTRKRRKVEEEWNVHSRKESEDLMEEEESTLVDVDDELSHLDILEETGTEAKRKAERESEADKDQGRKKAEKEVDPLEKGWASESS
jgi:CHASE3 domain sensor protein